MSIRSRFAAAAAATSAVVAAVGLLGTACTPADPVDGNARDASVLELIVAAVVEDEFGERNELEPLPVLYVVGRETKVPFDVQAAVVAASLGRVDLRFADARTEALDESLELLPVRDGGRLLVVGPVPATGTSIEVGVEIYADADDIVDGVAALRYVSGSWLLEGIEFTGTT